MNSMNFWSMSNVFFCLRLIQPMRTRRRCWKSISAVSPMALWKPTKKGRVIGSKTKDLLWRGVWPIFNRPVTFYTMLTEQTLSLSRFKVDKTRQIQFTTLFKNVPHQLRIDPVFMINSGAVAPEHVMPAENSQSRKTFTSHKSVRTVQFSAEDVYRMKLLWDDNLNVFTKAKRNAAAKFWKGS